MLVTLRGVAFCFVASMAACIPIRETFWEAVGYPGPQNMFNCEANRFAFIDVSESGEIRLEVSDAKTYKNIGVVLKLKDGDTAQFQSAEVAFKSLDGVPIVEGASAVTGTLAGICGSGNSFSCLERVAPTSLLTAGQRTHRFDTFVPIPDQIGQDFYVQLPKMRVNGVDVTLPAVHFRYKSRVTITPGCA